jgi:hypothetical protein
MKKIEIFMQWESSSVQINIFAHSVIPRESGSAKLHNKTHQCPENDPCCIPGYRTLGSDDWVKFGAVIWAGRSLQRQQLTLDFYKAAWTKLYETDPLLNRDGGPANFLHNPQYTCSKPVPWLAAALTEDPADSSTFNNAEEDTFNLETGPSTTTALDPSPTEAEPGSSSNIVDEVATNLEPGPSTTVAADRALTDVEPGPSRTLATSPAVFQQEAGPDVGEAYHLGFNPLLQDLLRNCPYKMDALSPFPKIKDGFFPGFRQYLEGASFKRFRVIFPIIPQYRIQSRNQQTTPYINFMDLSPGDVEAISEADPQCLYRSDDQKDCPEGQVRYFCLSWVSLYRTISNGKPLIISLCIACSGS